MHLLKCKVEERLDTRLKDIRPVGGGDAAQAYVVDTLDGTVFVKTVSSGRPFPMEALGLQRIKQPGGTRIPEVLHVEDQMLILEYIPFSTPGKTHQEQLGRGLARIHRTSHSAFGFEEDHFIGAAPQKNQPWVEDAPGAWARFWWSHRLEPMIRNVQDPSFRSRLSALESRLEAIIADTALSPRMLHGDLWSGNVAADDTGAPVIFDPAPYYGHPEADLAMTRMFGGFTPSFYDAYTEAHPLPEGWQKRLDFYLLYHVLNHLNLFGSPYRSRAEAVLEKINRL